MKMTRNTAILSAMLASAAFANGAAAPAPTAGTPAPVKKAGAPKADERVAPEFTAVVSDIAPPAAKSGRGQKSELAKQLDALEVNQSIGIKNKSKKQISSTLSKINNAESNLVQKTDANGVKLTKNGEAIKDANGAHVGFNQVPDMQPIKTYEAHDVDAKKDPQGASVRIWRMR